MFSTVVNGLKDSIQLVSGFVGGITVVVTFFVAPTHKTAVLLALAVAASQHLAYHSGVMWKEENL